MKIQKSVDIRAAPEQVWPFLVEPEKIMKWFTLLKKFEYTGAKRGGLKATFYYEEKSGPLTMKMNYVVTEWVENRRIVFVMTSGSMKKDDQIWSLEPTAAGSRFTLIEDYEVSKGAVGRMVDSLSAGMIARGIEKILGNLKRLVES